MTAEDELFRGVASILLDVTFAQFVEIYEKNDFDRLRTADASIGWYVDDDA